MKSIHRSFATPFRTAMSVCAAGAATFLLCTASSAQPAGRQDVSVRGLELLLNGRQWIPHGVYQIAFEQPPTYSDEHAFWKVASRFYSPEEYANMRRFGADLVRIQVSQPGMDPANRLSTGEYREKVLSAVRSARNAGLVVIVSVQDERQSGEGQPAELPNDATQRVWRVITPAFRNDRGVMFELFNEPRPQATPSAWRAWAAAMSRTLMTVRDLGAVNVVIADGLSVGRTLRGAPLLEDPLRQVAYGSHPYATKQTGPRGQTPEAWDEWFGNFSHRGPVIISEWGIGYYCDANTPRATDVLLGYLQQHRIGLVAGTWDWAPEGFRSIRLGFPHPRTSSFGDPSTPALCNSPGYGPGQLVESWFTNHGSASSEF